MGEQVSGRLSGHEARAHEQQQVRGLSHSLRAERPRARADSTSGRRRRRLLPNGLLKMETPARGRHFRPIEPHCCWRPAAARRADDKFSRAAATCSCWRRFMAAERSHCLRPAGESANGLDEGPRRTIRPKVSPSGANSLPAGQPAAPPQALCHRCLLENTLAPRPRTATELMNDPARRQPASPTARWPATSVSSVRPLARSRVLLC